MDTEKFYDEEIAPELLKLCKKCKEKGISFVAVVEYLPDELSTTYFINKAEGTAITMVKHCARVGRNIDGFVFGMKRWMTEKGRDFSQSIIMNIGDHN